MFGKLFGYEFRYSARVVPFIYIGLVASAAVCRLMLELIGLSRYFIIPFVLTLLFYILVFCAALLVPYVMSVVRFYKNMVGDEGYLTFTLPVKTSVQIAAKMICAVVWMLMSIIVAVGSTAIIWLSEDSLSNLNSLISQIVKAYQSEGVYAQFVTMIIEYAVVIILNLAAGIGMIYAAMALGQLVRGHKVLGAIGFYFALSIASSTVSGIVGAVTMLAFGTGNSALMSFFSSMNINLGVMILVYILFGAAYFILTERIMTKKLNLD